MLFYIPTEGERMNVIVFCIKKMYISENSRFG